MNSLASDLAAFRAEFMGKVPAEIRDAMERADAELLASGIVEKALKAGDKAPAFNLPNVTGEAVALRALLKSGPVVLSFYRGGWCPYCNLELRALQAALPGIEALGAKLVAVSPQTPDESLSTAEKNELAFAVLSDGSSAVAKSFGIAFDLAEELRPIYSKFGHGLPEMNGSEDWVLPMPANYVIDQSGTIAFAFVDPDYRNRLEPAAILEVLSALAKKTAA
ncbi:peroxiredoxin-like family protein [Parerythrobacter aurantius]|uniref:peroxiredoxin-like family protein n=1 Tax=Parerythrobacter aurantius TaxID=3127706 RepID=UPI0032489E44